MASRATCVSLMIALIAAALLASVKADQYGDCMAAVNKLTKRDDLSESVPSCQRGLSGLRKCCTEIKQLLGAVPSKCFCNARVWAKAEQWLVAESGFDNLDARHLKRFYSFCGIRNAGSGTC